VKKTVLQNVLRAVEPDEKAPPSPWEKKITIRVNVRFVIRMIYAIIALVCFGEMLWCSYTCGHADGTREGEAYGRKTFCTESWCKDKK